MNTFGPGVTVRRYAAPRTGSTRAIEEREQGLHDLGRIARGEHELELPEGRAPLLGIHRARGLGVGRPRLVELPLGAVEQVLVERAFAHRETGPDVAAAGLRAARGEADHRQ